MIHDVVLLVLGLVLLVAGANYMTDGAVAVAKRFRVPTLIIGLTVVALGSSMPDIVVCVESSLEHKTAIAVGEVVGANIFDLLLVVGIMAMIRPWKVSKVMRSQDLPLLFIASTALWIAGDTLLFDSERHNVIDRTSGLMLLIIFVFYMWFMIQSSRNSVSLPKPSASGAVSDAASSAVAPSAPAASVSAAPSASRAAAVADADKGVAHAGIMRLEVERVEAGWSRLRSRQWFAWVMIVAGLGALVIGGNWVVDGASGLALKAGMSQGMVALTVVAIGNSLPDLVTSVTATVKGASGIALGNIVGACIINALLAIGLSATITPLSADTIGFVDFMTLAGASLLLWLIPALRPSHRMGRGIGAALTILYAAYFAFTIIRG